MILPSFSKINFDISATMPLASGRREAGLRLSDLVVQNGPNFIHYRYRFVFRRHENPYSRASAKVFRPISLSTPRATFSSRSGRASRVSPASRPRPAGCPRRSEACPSLVVADLYGQYLRCTHRRSKVDGVLETFCNSRTLPCSRNSRAVSCAARAMPLIALSCVL